MVISRLLSGPLNSPTPVWSPRALYRPNDQARAKQFPQRLSRTILAVGKQAMLAKPSGCFHRFNLRAGLRKQPYLQVLVDPFDVSHTTPRRRPFFAPGNYPARGCPGTLPRPALRDSQADSKRLPRRISSDIPHLPLGTPSGFHRITRASRHQVALARSLAERNVWRTDHGRPATPRGTRRTGLPINASGR